MTRVEKTPEAVASLKAIGRYIAEQSGSHEISERFLCRIAAKCEQYARQPSMGDARPDLGSAVRCLSVGSYVVLYEPRDHGICVLYVVHGARDIPACFRRLFGRKGR